jgi:hypothetical protein
MRRILSTIGSLFSAYLAVGFAYGGGADAQKKQKLSQPSLSLLPFLDVTHAVRVYSVPCQRRHLLAFRFAKLGDRCTVHLRLTAPPSFKRARRGLIYLGVLLALVFILGPIRPADGGHRPAAGPVVLVRPAEVRLGRAAKSGSHHPGPLAWLRSFMSSSNFRISSRSPAMSCLFIAISPVSS